MANREALRTLHTRLAERLQAAKTTNVAASWLAVVCGGQNFLLPLAQAGEIFAKTPTMHVPYANHWFLGVANLRGGLFGVVDLAAFISQKARGPVSDRAVSETRYVTFNPELEINCGLQIDRLAGLRNLDAFVSSHAAPVDAAEYMGAVYVTADGLKWQEINLQILSRQPHFLSISA
jgi:twitching motility protein PilI